MSTAPHPDRCFCAPCVAKRPPWELARIRREMAAEADPGAPVGDPEFETDERIRDAAGVLAADMASALEFFSGPAKARIVRGALADVGLCPHCFEPHSSASGCLA